MKNSNTTAEVREIESCMNDIQPYLVPRLAAGEAIEPAIRGAFQDWSKRLAELQSDPDACGKILDHVYERLNA